MNRKQFIEQVKSTQGDLRRFLIALCCGDTQLADDIAQDALMKAYISIETLNDENRFKQWVMKKAYNQFISNRRTFHPTEQLDTASAIPSSSASDDSFRFQSLYEALSKLSDKERTAVVLYYMEGYTTKEIAETTNAGESAVRQLIARGRNHLKDML